MFSVNAANLFPFLAALQMYGFFFKRAQISLCFLYILPYHVQKRGAFRVEKWYFLRGNRVLFAESRGILKASVPRLSGGKAVEYALKGVCRL